MRRAIVTGSASGIGAAIAARLVADGWRVEALDRSPTPAAAGLVPHTVDLTDRDATRALLRTLLAAGTPDALVHAAGILRPAPLGRLDAESGAAMWRVHVEAATTLADTVLPAMAAAGRGRMVLIGSRVSAGIAGRSQYAASKAALVALARSWAAEVVERGVTVNVVSPAATDTPMLRDPARTGVAPKLPPIGRLIAPAEVAALVAFLLGDEAAAITGQDIAVCGGASLPR